MRRQRSRVDAAQPRAEALEPRAQLLLSEACLIQPRAYRGLEPRWDHDAAECRGALRQPLVEPGPGVGQHGEHSAAAPLRAGAARRAARRTPVGSGRAWQQSRRAGHALRAGRHAPRTARSGLEKYKGVAHAAERHHAPRRAAAARAGAQRRTEVIAPCVRWRGERRGAVRASRRPALLRVLQ